MARLVTASGSVPGAALSTSAKGEREAVQSDPVRARMCTDDVLAKTDFICRPQKRGSPCVCVCSNLTRRTAMAPPRRSERVSEEGVDTHLAPRTPVACGLSAALLQSRFLWQNASGPL